MAVPSRGRLHVKVGVTLSSSEAEFVAASQAGQEVLYLRALLKGFAYLQQGGERSRPLGLLGGSHGL